MATKVTILRHAQSDTGVIVTSHHFRPISDEGRKQAEERRKKLGNPRFDLVLCSHLLRTRQTAQIIAASNTRAVMIALPELFYDDSQPRGQAIERAFEKLKHAPLRAYYQEVREEMRGHGHVARDAILESIKLLQGRNVLVVGHGTLIPPMMGAFLSNVEPFLDRVLGECQGYHLTIESRDRVTSFEPID